MVSQSDHLDLNQAHAASFLAYNLHFIAILTNLHIFECFHSWLAIYRVYRYLVSNWYIITSFYVLLVIDTNNWHWHWRVIQYFSHKRCVFEYIVYEFVVLALGRVDRILEKRAYKTLVCLFLGILYLCQKFWINRDSKFLENYDLL